MKFSLNNLLPDNFELSKEFEDISEQIEHSDDNFYITGKAGSGKSTLLSYFRTITQKKVAVLAPTGVAAIRVKGQTIHSFFRFPPKVMQTKHIRKVWDQDILLNLEVLIIDEISMVRADVFDAIDYSLRVHRKKLTKPFGGVQLVVFGDLFQLPPVVNFDESDYKKASVKLVGQKSNQVYEYELTAGSDILPRTLEYSKKVLMRSLGKDIKNFDKNIAESYMAEQEKIMIHTGSSKILNGLKNLYNLKDTQIKESFDTLSEYGNLTGVSLPTVMNKALYKNELIKGKCLLVGITMGFGVDMVEVEKN